jgi:Trk-type K+ transport system membrane component
VRWIRFHVDNPVLAVWKIFFAVVAILDMTSCWSLLVQGWMRTSSGTGDQHHQQHDQKVCLNTEAAAAAAHGGGGLKFPFNNSHNKSQQGGACYAATAAEPSTWPFFSSSASTPLFSTLQRHGWIWRQWVLTNAWWIGPLFGLLCLVEAVVRAREARLLAIETQALDNFEKSLERVYSSTRMSFRRRFSSRKLQQRLLLGGHDHDGGDEDEDDYTMVDTTLERVLARSTLRTWIPTMTVICFWLALVPMPSPTTQKLMQMSSISSLYTCGNDTALATVWITNMLTQYAHVTKICQEFILSTLLTWALPYKLHQQPIRFFHRIRQLLRWIRYARFAFPLGRMFLKLLDQVSALTKTWRYVCIV